MATGTRESRILSAKIAARALEKKFYGQGPLAPYAPQNRAAVAAFFQRLRKAMTTPPSYPTPPRGR